MDQGADNLTNLGDVITWQVKMENKGQTSLSSFTFDDTLISNIPTYRRTELGISHVLERRRVFPHLTVKQNLLLGAWHPNAKKELLNSLSKVYKIFPKLETRSDQLAKTMSGGEQQMLAIARGMMGLPKLLMVDEPFLGLSPMVMKDLIKIFKNIVEEGISILFVEQNVRLALSMADRGYVLESGRLVIDGKSEDLIAVSYTHLTLPTNREV